MIWLIGFAQSTNAGTNCDSEELIKVLAQQSPWTLEYNSEWGYSEGKIAFKDIDGTLSGHIDGFGGMWSTANGEISEIACGDNEIRFNTSQAVYTLTYNKDSGTFRGFNVYSWHGNKMKSIIKFTHEE